MQNTTKDLVELGLTQGEAKVYLALLELGSTTAGPVVKNANVSYSKIYEIFDRLLEKGLATFVIKNRTKYFKATSPEDFLENKGKEIHKQERILSEILPKLKERNVKPEEEAEIFVGLKGLKAAYLTLFTENPSVGEWVFLYLHRKEYAKESDIFYKGMLKWFKIKIPARGIANEEYRGTKLIFKTTKMRYVNFLIPGNIDIFQDKIMIVSWGTKPVAFLIRSKEITEIMKEYFESVWKIAKK